MKTSWLYRLAGLVCLLLCLVQTRAQPPKRDQLVGRWVGVSTEWDENAYCPLPALMDLQPDSTWRLGLLDGSATPREGKWSILSGDTLNLNAIRYAPELVSLRGDVLRVGRVQPMTFRRFRSVPINREAVWQRLAGQVWQSDSVLFFIAPDGRTAVRNRQTGQQTIHYTEVTAMDESAFLIIRGSAGGREGNIRSFGQIVGNDVGVIRLLTGTGATVGTETLRWVRALEKEERFVPTAFQPCMNCFARVLSYVFVNIQEADRRTAFDLFRKKYKPVGLAGQSGVVFLSFIENCAGERSPINVQEYDTDYKRRPFDKRITDQLVSIVRNDIPTGLFSTGEQPHDSKVSFTFRFIDGQLTDVF